METPKQDRTEVHIGSASQVLGTAYKRVRDAFLKTVGVGQVGGLRVVPTQNELTLPSDLFAIKRKLGKSFFTKKRSRSHARKIKTLTSAERRLATAKGWL